MSAEQERRGRVARLDKAWNAPMLEELDKRAEELNITWQAVIKTLIRQALDQHYLATAVRRIAKVR